MSALKDYADIIAVVRKTDLPDEAETFGDGMCHAIKAMAAELEQRDNDAALGRLVRQMRTGWCLWQVPREGVWYWHVDDDDDGPVGYGLTPEAALQEALKEQDE